jgi:hypothetical protein
VNVAIPETQGAAAAEAANRHTVKHSTWTRAILTDREGKKEREKDVYVLCDVDGALQWRAGPFIALTD